MSHDQLNQVHIKPRKGWGYLDLKEVFEFRDLGYFLIWREIKGRYRQMALGPLWIILKPFMTMVILSLVFGKLAKLPSDGVPYPVFSYAALLPWTMFSVAVSKSSTSLVSNMGIISKVFFPRLVVPIAAAAAGVVDFMMSFLILLGMTIFYGYYPGWNMLWLPGFLILALAAAVAIGLCLATLAVKFRDVSFAVDHMLQVAMYLTPVVYSTSMIPENLRGLYMLNPMAVVVEGFRWAMFGQGDPFTLPALVSCLIVLALLIAGAYSFKRTERNIVDVL